MLSTVLDDIHTYKHQKIPTIGIYGLYDLSYPGTTTEVSKVDCKAQPPIDITPLVKRIRHNRAREMNEYDIHPFVTYVEMKIEVTDEA